MTPKLPGRFLLRMATLVCTQPELFSIKAQQRLIPVNALTALQSHFRAPGQSLMRRAPSMSSAPQASVPGLRSALGRERTEVARDRLGLSAEGLWKVLGVSARSVYNWERGKARIRQDQIAKLSQLRKVGKRQVMAFLPQQGRTQGKAATQ